MRGFQLTARIAPHRTTLNMMHIITARYSLYHLSTTRTCFPTLWFGDLEQIFVLADGDVRSAARAAYLRGAILSECLLIVVVIFLEKKK